MYKSNKRVLNELPACYAIEVFSYLLAPLSRVFRESFAGISGCQIIFDPFLVILDKQIKNIFFRFCRLYRCLDYISPEKG